MFYLNGSYKDNILPDKSKSYEVDTGTHSLKATRTNGETLVSDIIKIKFGKDGKWTIRVWGQSNYEDIEY